VGQEEETISVKEDKRCYYQSGQNLERSRKVVLKA